MATKVAINGFGRIGRNVARAILERRPTLVTVRRSRGRDVQAACGQLVQS